MSVAMYRAIDGFANNFWGWGGEDNVIYHRAYRHSGFRRLLPKVGLYAQEDHSRPDKKQTVTPSASNNRKAYFDMVLRVNAVSPYSADGYSKVNATILRYAPLPQLGAFHWVTASLDSMAYRPGTNGLESTALTEARLYGALPSLESLGLWTDGSLHIKPFTAAELKRKQRLM